MRNYLLNIKKEINSLGFTIVSRDFERPCRGFLVIAETQAQEFSKLDFLYKELLTLKYERNYTCGILQQFD